nr:putative ankyrin repeat protein [Quercus suber]
MHVSICYVAFCPNAQSGEEGDALQTAAGCCRRGGVYMLFGHGAKIHALGGQHSDALQAASYKGWQQVFQRLLDHGADLNALETDSNSALHAVAFRACVDVMQTLIDIGACVNAQGGPYRDVLLAAVRSGNDGTVKILRNVGAAVVNGDEQGCNTRYKLHFSTPATVAPYSKVISGSRYVHQANIRATNNRFSQRSYAQTKFVHRTQQPNVQFQDSSGKLIAIDHLQGAFVSKTFTSTRAIEPTGPTSSQ